MGTGSFSSVDWAKFTATKTAGKSTAHVFTKHTLIEDLDPKKIILRESRDSTDNPNSTPLIVGLDVTGSMGMIADIIARDGLKTLFTEIYDRKPITDPHIMFMGIGDVYCDRAPLQVSQFEADIRIADQLTNLFLEHGGGGNRCESYTLPWYFAAMKTSLDSYEKRKKKGYLFTVGDEEPPEIVTAKEFEKVFGPGQYSDLTSEQMLDMVNRMFHVFHIVIEEGSNCRYPPSRERVMNKWHNLLGQNVIPLSDYTKLSEVIVSTIQVVEGEDVAKVSNSWSSNTSLVVTKAIGGLTPVRKSGNSKTIVEF
jgi:hypothetical protein